MTAMEASEIRSRAFFGRRKGHRLRPHQARLIDTLLPDLAIDLTRPAPAELAALFSSVTGVDPDVEKIVAARDLYTINYLDTTIERQQQGIADAFLQLGLIPHAVDVRAIAYVPSAKARAALAQLSRQ